MQDGSELVDKDMDISEDVEARDCTEAHVEHREKLEKDADDDKKVELLWPLFRWDDEAPDERLLKEIEPPRVCAFAKVGEIIVICCSASSDDEGLGPFISFSLGSAEENKSLHRSFCCSFFICSPR